MVKPFRSTLSLRPAFGQSRPGPDQGGRSALFLNECRSVLMTDDGTPRRQPWRFFHYAAVGGLACVYTRACGAAPCR